MPSIHSLVAKLRSQYPQLLFQEGEIFEWSPPSRTITYDPGDKHANARLLHELGHAELGHTTYSRDIELIAHERDAWHHARTVLAPRLGIKIDESVAEDDMDTYRDWMHARSICPQCSANGLQSSAQYYTCVICRQQWQVNDARQRRLYRRLVSTV